MKAYSYCFMRSFSYESVVSLAFHSNSCSGYYIEGINYQNNQDRKSKIV